MTADRKEENKQACAVSLNAFPSLCTYCSDELGEEQEEGDIKERPVAKTKEDQFVARRRQGAAGFTC
jgi:hypothetical protein